MLLPSPVAAVLSRPARLFLALASGLAYLVVFWLLYPAVGPDISILSVVPVMVISGLLGFWPGVLAGGLLIPVNSLLLSSLGETFWDLVWRYRLGHLAGLIVGGVVGLLSDASRLYRAQSADLAREIAERRGAEAALRDMQATLEARVQERTAALQESEARYRQLYESNRVVQLLIDPQTLRIVDGNAAAAGFYGYARPTLAGMPIAQLNTLPVDEIRTRMTAAVAQSHSLHRFRHRLASGAIREVEVDASPVWEGGRQLIHVLVRDITEQNRYTTVLQRYRLLSEHTRDILLFVRAADGQVLEANAAALAAYGYSEAELLRLTIYALRAPGTQDLVPGQLQQADATGLLFETTHRRKDGSLFPVEVSSRGLDLDSERVLLSIVRDVSARRETEAALRQSEQRFQLFMQHFPGLAYLKDAETRVLFVNQGFETYLSIRPAEVMGKLNAEIFPADFAELMTAADRRVLESGRSEVLEESFAGRTWATYKFAIPQAGRPTLLGGLTLDITERKAMEQALVAANQRLERILDGIHDGFFILDHDWRYTYVNTAAAASGFATREALLGQRIWDLAPGEVGGAFYQACWRARDEGLASAQTDAYYDYGERGAKWYNLAIYPFEGGVAVHYRDITDRKRAELALQENEYFLTKSQEVGDLGSYYLNAQTGRWISSPKLDAIFGIDDAFARDVAGWLELVHPDDRAAMQAYLAEHVLQHHNRFDREYRIIRHTDGQERWMHGLGELEFDAAGQPLKMIGTIQDITERRRTEQALRENEYFLTKSQEVGDLGSYYLNAQTGQWISSPKLDAILGIDDVYSKDVAGWLQLVHPEHRAAMEAYLAEHVLARHNRFDREYRIIRHTDGQERWMHGLGELEVDAAGQPLRMIGTIQDITQRKRADQALAESERRFRETLELSPLYAVVLDAAGRITFANGRLAQAAGSRPEALLGQDWFTRFIPPELDLRSVFNDRLQREGFPATFENEIVLPSGERRQVLWTNTNLRGAAGEVTGVASLGLDVTESRRLEHTLRENEAQLRLFYELPLIGMALTSPRTKRWVRVNDRLAEILGYPREVLIQKSWAELTHPDDLAADEAEFERVLSGASDGYRMDKRFIRPEGEIVYATIDVRCVRAEDGSVDFFVATVQDIGDRKRIEAELERRVAERTAQLEVSNQELEAFAYSVSHDLRAPLRAIDGFSLALLEDYAGQLDAPGQDYLRRVRQGAQQMGQLIDALLLLSRVTRQELSRQPVDLSHAAAVVAQALRVNDPDREVALTVPPGLVVNGDPRLLEILLTNLLGNAWKFTRRRPAARIELGLALIQGESAYFVRDNGVGFDAQYAATLFQPFQRLHSAAEFEGTGIGLATVHRIVQRHGGRVWAEGAPGAGATFYFVLPQ